MTDLIPGSSEWHELRRTGIGGSDASAVLGLSPWRTPYQVYADKIGETEPQPETEAMRWGTKLEPLIRQRYGEITGRIIRRPTFVRHPRHEWMFVNPDGVADGEILFEAKTSRTAEGWGEHETDEIPRHYLVDLHHGLIATGLPLANLAVLIGGSDFRIYVVEPDPIIHAEIIEREAEFWTRVLRRDPPPPVTLADAQRRWGRIVGQEQVVADRATMDAVENARAMQKAIKGYTEVLEDAKLAIASALADKGDTLVGNDGEVLATWRLQKGRAAYSVPEGKPFRQLRIKDAREERSPAEQAKLIQELGSIE